VADLLGPVAPDAALALICMAFATWLCRAGGVWLMTHVPITPRVRRGLSALPGSIMIATVLPIAVKSGPAAIAALVAAILAMLKWRKEVIALGAGLLTVSLLRAAGF